MARNNQDRVAANNVPAEVLQQLQEVERAEQQTDQEEAQNSNSQNSSFSFTVPTEFVELPSAGRHYPEGHPLHNCETVEIRYMTAKEEDILTSPALVRKGLAIDRLIQNVLVDSRVKVESLLVGDKNAIVIACRSSGYGHEYVTTITCPVCGTRDDYSFDLTEAKVIKSAMSELLDAGVEVSETENGTFMFKLPKTQASVEVKLLTGKEERIISKLLGKRNSKNNDVGRLLTTQLKTFIVSVNGHSEKQAIEMFVNTMPASDSRFLRTHYQKLVPNVDLTQQYFCDACGHEEDMEVPLTAEFFWPRS